MLFGRTKKNPIRIADKQVADWKYAACGYCSTGCSIEVGLNSEGRAVASRGVADADVNRGKLCLKGIFEHELFESAGRGLQPKMRGHWHEPWQGTDWDSALDKVHDEIAKFWNVDPEFFPKKRGMFQTDIYHAIESGQIKGLWLIATNPMSSLPNTSRIRRAMEKLEFCAVQDCYEDTESAQYAHVYLPAGTWAEKEGVMTNTERRVNLVKPISAPPAEAKPDLWIFNRMAERFNLKGSVKFPERAPDIFLEMASISRGRLADISGMNHALIEESRGIQWPYTGEQLERGEAPPKGGKRLYTEDASFSYPAYQRLNISMACNHCDDPVCLKGCPTRAYTKFAEYGAVLQDPDICFGCGYCTWVCPYNAPQLDPVQGQVSKCNMCVDRLEVGLKPACVSACLGKALDFGVVENIPEQRHQAKTEIPGFPRSDITHPNIRFQQTRTTQREMVRVDSTAVKYHRDDAQGSFRPVVDAKHGFKREWNLGKLLGSHENAHITFTLAVQTVMGAFSILVLGNWAGVAPVSAFHTSPAYLPLLLLMLALMGLRLFKLNMHLGKPHRFYRGFYNLCLSPVSREIAGVSVFFAGLTGYSLFELFEGSLAAALKGFFSLLALLGAALGGYYMYKLYRISARPFWDHWHTGASFAGTTLGLGSLLLALTALALDALTPDLGTLLARVAASGFALEGLGLLAHARDVSRQESEGAASFYEQSTTYGKSYWLRNVLLAVALVLAITLALGLFPAWAFATLTLVVLASALIGRALFYMLVIPTTMPGAFFWKNKGFVEHAREAGLAEMPQLGVAYERHHKFKLGELLETLRSTSLQEKLAQVKCIITG